MRPQQKTARLFHAFSDETRLAVLDRLRKGECCVCDLVDLLGAGQSRLSFHMKVLKDAGLVVDRREGRWIHYALNFEGLERAHQAIASLRDSKGASEAAACCAK
ncbi:MAG: ArsR/SmtB family transcription factor [Acidobacteriota bacterium]